MSKIEVEAKVRNILTESNLPKGSKSWIDYQSAKQSLEVLTLTDLEYVYAIKAITDWLEL